MSKTKKEVTIKLPPILFEKTQTIIKQISSSLDGDFIIYWLSGSSKIVEEDILAFYNILKSKQKNKKLYFYVKSEGGNGQASLRIVNLLRQFYEYIIAFVPLDCASAATMLALGANEIHMGPLGYLSAIDTSLVHDLSPLDKFNDLVSVSQNELTRVLKLWKDHQQSNDKNPYLSLYPFIHPLVFGAVDRASSLSMKLTTEILSYHLKEQNEAERISHHLNSDYPSHGYPIMLNEAQKIGLNVKHIDDNINDKLILINEFYSEMAQMAYTDFDELNYHDNEVLKILEAQDIQLYYQKDKDWHYRAEEKRWIPMNDESSWRKNELVNNIIEKGRFFIR